MNKSKNNISRRQFLKYIMLSLPPALSGGIFVSGCAIDPVTGQNQLMIISKQQEIDIDKHHSPFQFSADYGIIQDKKINKYISDVGSSLVLNVHRPDMPYNFQCVNAAYINAYAFPAGSIAVTRGILLKLDNEAQLAALLGHELGHVNARHTAEQVSKGQLSSILIEGLAVIADTQSSGLGKLTQQFGILGQSAFLSKYSRDNEREADYLGNEYMVKAGYSSKGFVGLMEMLNSLHKGKQSFAQVLFATHPMSHERLAMATHRANDQYYDTKDRDLKKERYMDNMASLRAQKQVIEFLQKGEKYLAKKEYDNAQESFQNAINKGKNDYTAHVMMAKCLILKKNFSNAINYTNAAKEIYPKEAQVYNISGIINLELKKYQKAYQDFARYDKLLSGNPQITFYKGYSFDNSNNIEQAANQYLKYLKMVNYESNKYSKHAYARLKKWGYVQ